MNLKLTLNTTERMSKLKIMVPVIFACLAPLTTFAQTYNSGDIAVINNIIDNNGLQWTKADPADGSSVPDDWTGIYWSYDVDNNKRITGLYISNQSLTGMLNLSELTGLKYLDVSYNNGISWNLSGCTDLQTFYCASIGLTSLDMSEFTNLQEFRCADNNLTSLDMSGCPNLTVLECAGNNLTSLDMSRCPNLWALDCSDNDLTSLDLSGCTELEELLYANNKLASFDVSGFINLTSLDCSYNDLTSLDVSKLTKIYELFCSGNNLKELDVSMLSDLYEFFCFGNHLTFLDLSGPSAFFDSDRFDGNDQIVNLAMTGDGSNYTANILFDDGVTFDNPDLSYSNGVLTSNSNTAVTSTFTSPTGLDGYLLTGTLNLTYDNDNPQPTTLYNVSIGTFDNGQVASEKYVYEEGETVILSFTPEQGYELASISAYKTDEPDVTVTLYNSDYTYIFSMPAYDVTVTATFRKTQETLDAEAVEEEKTVIENASYSVAQAVANTEAEIKTWLVDILNVPNQLHGIWYEDITITAVTPAVAGTEANPAGTNGSFKFTVILTIGTASLTTTEISGVIVATAYTADTGIDNPHVKGLEARIQNGTLYVSGLTVGQSWSVYNASGALVYQNTAVSGEENVNLIVRGVYLVKSDNKIIKVLY
ncbi:MAG: leucine-rich repeat domain-containing protein [Candidatus Azobacteroides sp.]|nr:leucine-rich repeat domain-containing protein [Candidatus Azobacteroides sp.]